MVWKSRTTWNLIQGKRLLTLVSFRRWKWRFESALLFFGEFLIPKVWEILINFFEYIFFLRIVNYFDQMKSSLILFPSSKGPRAKHFLEKSKYIKQIAPNGAFGIFSGPFRLIFEIYSCQTSRFKLGNWITMVTSLPYQNPQYIKMQKQRKQK